MGNSDQVNKMTELPENVTHTYTVLQYQHIILYLVFISFSAWKITEFNFPYCTILLLYYCHVQFSQTDRHWITKISKCTEIECFI